VAGFTLRAIVPKHDATARQRPSPAVHSAGMRATEKPTQRPRLLRPGRLARWAEHLIAWYQGFADRRLLASLDDRLLRDLGIDRSTIGGDSTASYWRLREPGRTDSALERRAGQRGGEDPER
jgi:uncharacterized protein YjiS (DUF1127 family)